MTVNRKVETGCHVWNIVDIKYLDQHWSEAKHNANDNRLRTIGESFAKSLGLLEIAAKVISVHIHTIVSSERHAEWYNSKYIVLTMNCPNRVNRGRKL